MDAVTSPHPTEDLLRSYGLGKLDVLQAEAVHRHLEVCATCRGRVAEVSSDSFLNKIRQAGKGSAKSIPVGALVDGTLSLPKGYGAPWSMTDTLPPGLADHPDYEIKRELGRGGMGVVYLAHNLLLGRDEVLKVIGRQIMERPGVLERFMREIRAVAPLRHANIVAAYSAFRIDGGLVFAMEYVEGLDLSRMVKAKGPLPVIHAAYFVHQVALGLRHAHEKGLVHRDIKPHNLMLRHDGKSRLVKVLDFGLAKATREERVDGGLTMEGQALGTPHYIAPEQILNAPDVDIRADIYSLGGTLYYLLTGRPPFQASSHYDIYQAHISRDADPLNFVRPEVPAELAALVAKMMAKDPARRFQTPGEVAKALKPFFKKANAAFKSPKPEVSQAGQANARPPPTGALSKSTQPATDAENVTVRTERAAETSATEPQWESLIEIREEESSIDVAPSFEPTRRPPWVWPAVAAGVLLFGLFAAWPAVVFEVRTPEGDLVFNGLPDDSVVTVDDKVYTVEWPGGKGLAKVSVPVGDHRVKVELNGVEVHGEEVMIAAGDKKWINVHWVPRVTSRPGKDNVGAPAVKTGEDPPQTAEVVVPRSKIADAERAGFAALSGSITNSVGMTLRLIPAGEFLMGSSKAEDKDAQEDEMVAGQKHRVRITRPFYLGVTEVTQGQYRTVTGQSPSQFKGSDDLPVETVSWLDAVEFCNALSRKENLSLFYRVDGQNVDVPDWKGPGYRLPTEAEWEYACRANNPARYNFGGDAAGLGDHAWIDGNSGKQTHPVGQKPPNAFGLRDMHGNVWEWCAGGYKDDFYARSPIDDPVSPPQGAVVRVFRGGGWDDFARYARSADRHRLAPDERSIRLGFRLARGQLGSR